MKPSTLSLHHFIKAVILFGFAMYIVYLVKTDGILYYIAPRMVDYIKWSSVAFYAMAVYQVYVGVNTLWKKQAECDCDHDHTPSTSVAKNIFIYGLFVFPLLLGFLLPDSTMGTSLASKKGMNLSSSSTVKKGSSAAATPAVPTLTPTPSPSATASKDVPAPSAASATNKPAAANSDAKLDEMFKADKFTEVYAKYGKKLYQSNLISVKEDSYIETLTTVDLYLDNFIGKKIELDGFVYRQDNMKENQFVVGRFAIQCCSADASPFGVMAEYDRAKVLATDSWIHATGTIQKVTFNDTEIMALKLEKFEKIEEPKTKYVYPNYEFGF
jgi:putative membrane protein